MQCLDRQSNGITDGVIWKQLLKFFLPIMLGTFFQQLYNTVDAIVVGNFAGKEALAAVGGSASRILDLVIGFFTGLASGATVIVSQVYGAKDEQNVSRSVHTAMLLALGGGAIMTVIGLLISPTLLVCMKTPPDTMAQSRDYVDIVFMAMIPGMVYNVGSAVLRAVGDSRRPFLFLVVCALVNTALDLLFVIGLGMGVEGVALATVLSQGISAVLVVVTLMRSDSCIRLVPSRLRMHRAMLGKIFAVGIPAALQMAVTAFSNVFVQSYINYFGADCMSGWTAYAKVDQLLFLPMQSIALASTTFVGQNLGRNLTDRARQGVRISLFLALCSTVVLMLPVMAFAAPVVAFFNSKPEVVTYGAMLLRVLSPFYVLCCFNQVYSGALRGAGNSKAPMVIMLSTFVAFRQLYLFVMSRICNEIIPIAMSYPAGWLLCSTLTVIYYHRVSLSKNRLVEDA